MIILLSIFSVTFKTEQTLRLDTTDSAVRGKTVRSILPSSLGSTISSSSILMTWRKRWQWRRKTKRKHEKNHRKGNINKILLKRSPEFFDSICKTSSTLSQAGRSFSSSVSDWNRNSMSHIASLSKLATQDRSRILYMLCHAQLFVICFKMWRPDVDTK